MNVTPRKPNLISRLRIVFKLVAVVLLVTMFGGMVAYSYVDTKLGKITRPEEKIDEAELSCVDVDGYINILLVGVDSRDLKNLEGWRADALIVASIKEETGEVFLTSIYRDTFLRMGDQGFYDKITHAFAYGGLETTIKSVNQALDLNIKDYILFNFKAVADVVDAIGGVDVYVEEYEIYELNKYTIETADNIGKKDYRLCDGEGQYTLDGAQAVSYGRIRKGVGDDFKRTERMRTIIGLILEKVKTMNVSDINKLIDTTLPQIGTSLSNRDIMLMGMNISKYSIQGSKGFPYNISTGYLNNISYVFPSDLYGDVVALHQNVFGQTDYVPSDTMIEISNMVAYYRGNSTGTMDLDVDEHNADAGNQDDILDDPTDDSDPQNPDDPGNGGDTGGGDTGDGGDTGGGDTGGGDTGSGDTGSGDTGESGAGVPAFQAVKPVSAPDCRRTVK